MHFPLLFATAFFAGDVLAARIILSPVDDYINKQYPLSKKLLLGNIGQPVGAAPGVTGVAEASNTNPLVKFTWVRDSAMVFKALVDEFTLGTDDSLRGIIDEFSLAQVRMQHTENPAGSVSTGGLAEVKFSLDLKPDTGTWSRPQNDGPPLRANILISYAEWLLAGKNTSFVEQVLWPSISLDIDHVINHWNEPSFELWEIVWTDSYWTAAMQARAVYTAFNLGRKLGYDEQVNRWEAVAASILCFMQSFWKGKDGVVASTTVRDRSGVDSATVLASIYNWDPAAGCDPLTLQPCSDRALANLKAVVDGFRSYPINPKEGAAAIGLWTEDQIYFHPWYLATFGVAEQLYDALMSWDRAGEITVTSTSQPFFRQFVSGIRASNFKKGNPTYRKIVAGVQEFADNTIMIAAKYTGAGGSLPQQFHNQTGEPVGASGLSWSYSASVTAFNARRGQQPVSWGAKDLVRAAASSCNGNVAAAGHEGVGHSEDIEGVFSNDEINLLEGLYREAEVANERYYTYDQGSLFEKVYREGKGFVMNYLADYY